MRDKVAFLEIFCLSYHPDKKKKILTENFICLQLPLKIKSFLQLPTKIIDLTCLEVVFYCKMLSFFCFSRKSKGKSWRIHKKILILKSLQRCQNKENNIITQDVMQKWILYLWVQK